MVALNRTRLTIRYNRWRFAVIRRPFVSRLRLLMRLFAPVSGSLENVRVMASEPKSIFAAKSTWIALISILVCMVGGAWLDQLSHQLRPGIASWLQTGSILLITIGIGVLVSVFFIKPMEDRRQERQLMALEELRQKIQQDVLAATMGKLVLPSIFAVVKRDVFERGFVATKARWEIAFHILPDERIQSLAQIFYEILNTREVEHAEQRTAIINPTEEGKVLSSLVRVGGKEVINSAKNLGHYEILQERGTYEITHEFHIPGKGRAESIAVYEEFYKGPVMETMFLSYPTEELEISAHFPEGWEFKLISYSSSQIECYHQTKTTCHYRFKEALLHGQAVLYTLSPPSDVHKRQPAPADSRNEEITVTE